MPAAPPTSGTALSPAQIVDVLTQRFGGRILKSFTVDKHPRVHVDATDWREVAEFIHGDPGLQLDFLKCISALDYVAENKLAAVFDLRSSVHGHDFAVKVYTDRANPAIPSTADLWPAGDWHEREAFDLMGIDFPGHPDLRRILLPEDWVGHPLRKDYEFRRQYHGIPGSYELNWQQKPTYPK